MASTITKLDATARIPFDRCPLCAGEDALEIKVADCREHPLYDASLPPDIHWIACDGCGHVRIIDRFTKRSSNSGGT